MRKKRKLFEIKVYEYNTTHRFYRAEHRGISVPSRTIKGAVNGLLKTLDDLAIIQLKEQSTREE